MNFFFSIARKIRSVIIKRVKPISSYWLATKSVKPLSDKFGYDRGTPIDRYWIETFLAQKSDFIRGRCLEITDPAYTKRFGGNKVTHSDVLDIDKKNSKANIFADLRHLEKMPANTYDTIILTHVLGMIDDYDAVIKGLKRILKPGGSLLVTVSSFAPLFSGIETNFWRFTVASAKYVFGKHFKHLEVVSRGNVLTGQAFWVGIAQEELTKDQLAFDDPRFSCVITIHAKK